MSKNKWPMKEKAREIMKFKTNEQHGGKMNKFKTLLVVSICGIMFLSVIRGFAGTSGSSSEMQSLVNILVKKGYISQKQANKILRQEKVKQARKKQQEKKEISEMIKKETAKWGGFPAIGLRSHLSLKGRFFAGLIDSQNPGTNYLGYGHAGSFQIPEAKIALTWSPTKRISVVERMNLSNATFNGLDYFYLQINKILPWDTESNLKIGQVRLNVGEETWTNNPVGDTAGLISNSASNVTGFGRGIELDGYFYPKLLPNLGYAVSATNGTGTQTVADSDMGYSGKIFWTPIKPLYISGSYYTAEMKSGLTSALSIAGLNTAPAGTVNDWKRNLWEGDVEYTIIKPLKVAGAYGHFSDKSDTGTKRDGDYWYVQTKYDFTPKFFAGIRYSRVKLGSGEIATLDSIASANQYTRTSVGVGYHLNKLVTLKAEYDWNQNTIPGLPKIDDNLFAAGVAAQF